MEFETECKVEQMTNPAFDFESNIQIKDDLMDDIFGQPLENKTIIYDCTKVDNISNSEEPTKNHDVIVNDNLVDVITRSDCHMETICKESMTSNTEEKQGKSRFNQDEFNAEQKVIEPKSQEKKIKITNPTANTIFSTKSLTRSQIEEHIISLRNQYNKVIIAFSVVFSLP